MINPIPAAAGLRVGRPRRSAGEAELAAIAPNREPTIRSRILGPLAAVAVTFAVWGLLATSLAAGVTMRDGSDPA